MNNARRTAARMQLMLSRERANSTEEMNMNIKYTNKYTKISEPIQKVTTSNWKD